jgi:predicted ATPase/class 3 adenylate cyclase
MADLPRGTVTFLFTDIEGSTALWERDRAVMRAAVERQIGILREAVGAHNGVLFKVIGDATQSAFALAPDAVAAAIAAQHALLAESWAEELPVRMALHAGEATPHDSDYLAAPLNRLARLLTAGHGGQILLTQAVRQLIRDTLPAGVIPRHLGAHCLRDLHEPEEVFQVVAAGLPEQFPPLLSQPVHPTNLAAPPTALIGRELEVAMVLRLLDEGARLVTLTGPGGTGKTRLALEVAAEALDQYPHGVFFVDLSPLTDPALVVPTIAATLGVREVAGRPLSETLAAHLGQKCLLLVLDNYERVLDAAPDAAALLAVCPDLAILTTSREPLHVRVEREVAVAPLPLPNPNQLPPLGDLAAVPSVALFVEKARAASATFALTVENAEAIAAICHRLDGLPLAIELAAARVKVLPPGVLLARLEHRLPLLTGGARDLPARQRTLRQTMAWSYDLLVPLEQALFRRLAVFAGGWTLDAAEEVTNPDNDLDVLAGMTSLADKSLIWLDAIGPEPRYRMLETVREFELEEVERAGELVRIRGRHAVHISALAERMWLETQRGPVTSYWLTSIPREIDNIRLALAWFMETGDYGALLRLSGALHSLWHWGGHWREGLGWVQRALDADDGLRACFKTLSQLPRPCAGDYRSPVGRPEKPMGGRPRRAFVRF